MRRIALISCSKSKQNYPCPARELYAPSQLFSLSYQYAKKVADEVYVLSARYGLLAEEDVVAPYDLTLTDLPKHRQRDWANYVLCQMGERFDLNRDVFVILAGRNYYKNLLPHLVHTALPLGNLRIGPRLSFLEQELARLSRGDPPVVANEFDNGCALCVRLHQMMSELPRYTWEEISSVPFRNGIYIVDLQKTVRKLEEAYNFVRQLSESGQSLLFVGTKKQAQEAIREEATRCGQYYVNARWLGGMMTNFKTMRTRVDRLNQLKTMQTDGTFDMLPKKEVMKHLGEIAKLEKYLGGVKDMKKLPGALFIVDTRKERNAIAEAHKLNIPVVAIADTNCDPDEIDYVIPGNDDAIRAIKLISSIMANAVLEGKQGEQTEEAAETAEDAQ